MPSNLRLNKTSVDGIIFPGGRGRNYNRERSSGNGLLITTSFYVSSSVNIEKLIYVIKHPDEEADTTLPEPLSLGDFVERLEGALQKEESEGKNDKLNLDRFREVVFATAKDDADWQSWGYHDAWVSAVWVR